MTRFFSIGGMSPSGGEGGMGQRGGESYSQARETVRQDPRYAEFFADRDRREREQPDHFASGFTPGDRERFGGEAATVEHVEFDQHSGKERLYMRGDKTGTFIADWQKTDANTAVLQRAKRTHE
jgi:hypothetical protein